MDNSRTKRENEAYGLVRSERRGDQCIFIRSKAGEVWSLFFIPLIFSESQTISKGVPFKLLTSSNGSRLLLSLTFKRSFTALLLDCTKRCDIQFFQLYLVLSRYEKAITAMAKQSVTLEVLSYHASASLEDAQRLRVSIFFYYSTFYHSELFGPELIILPC